MAASQTFVVTSTDYDNGEWIQPVTYDHCHWDTTQADDTRAQSPSKSGIQGNGEVTNERHGAVMRLTMQLNVPARYSKIVKLGKAVTKCTLSTQLLKRAFSLNKCVVITGSKLQLASLLKRLLSKNVVGFVLTSRRAPHTSRGGNAALAAATRPGRRWTGAGRPASGGPSPPYAPSHATTRGAGRTRRG
eukprot:4863554-Pleurochrysis_carterae.AAC.6